MSVRRLVSTERPSAPIAILAVWLIVYSALSLGVETRAAPVPLIINTAYMPFRMLTTYLLWLAARRSTSPAIARGWLLLAAGQLFAVAGNSTWVVSDLAGVDTSNATYLAWTIPFSVLTIAGFVQLMRPRDGRTKRAGDWLDAAVLVVACATIAWYFIAARLVTTGYDDATGVFLFFFDSATNGATVLLAVTVWLRKPHGLAPAAMPRIVIALLMLAAGDLIIEAEIARGTYHIGSLLDIWYASAVLVFALGADAQCRNPSGAATVEPPHADRADALVFGAVAASLAPLTVEVGTSDFLSSALAASGIGVVVLMLLVLWRQRIARQEIDQLVAARLHLEHQLWQAQKLEAIGQMAGGIAHDFNNILAAISAHAQLLRLGSPSSAVDEAREIEFATQRAAVLVRRLLTFSRVSSTTRQPVVLGDVVRTMQAMLRPLVVAEIELDVTIEDGGGVVELADGQLEQILLNLVINARDAAPGAGRIGITTRRVTVQARDALHRRGVAPGVWAVLEVRDNGSGMSAETQSRLFQPFFTTKAETGGTGLGLATVAGIVTAADGHILVESAPGAGTVMTVYLPVAAISADRRAEATLDTASQPVTGTIMVVDDELPIRTALARYLTRHGHTVIEAADVTQALSLLEQREWDVDLILTDVRMPERTGIEMAAIARARRPDIPILFMSGYADAPVRGGAHGAPPAADMIDKPFDLDVVAERVRERLTRRG